MPRISGIIEGTAVDGPGLRTSIYFSGCRHRCPGCHNPETWDFDAGVEMNVDEIVARVEENGFNVTFSGGDPMYQAMEIIPLAKKLKSLGYNIWCYTGFCMEELSTPAAPEGAAELLGYIDTLVDGPFIESLRDTNLRFRGSSNQRIIELS